jgi:TonB-dependent starch-binding outer membrane protein SusC
MLSKTYISCKILLFIGSFLFFSKALSGKTKPVAIEKDSINIERIIGRVTDEKGNPLIGAGIMYKGDHLVQTYTDSLGFFSFELTKSHGTISVEFPGFQPLEIKFAGKHEFDIVLKPITIQIGYGRLKKEDIPNSVLGLQRNQWSKVPVQNLNQALQGLVAGVDIVQSEDRPGSPPSVLIRGRRSLSGEDTPLYVLDGIPMPYGLDVDAFNPEDFQSITVLKDASATAIYGSRGANGVILLQSIPGEKGKFRIDYHSYYGLSKPLSPTRMMSGAEFAEYRRESQRSRPFFEGYNTPYPNPEQDYLLFGTDPNSWESVAMGYEWEDKSQRIPKYRPATVEEKEHYAKWGLGAVDKIPVYNPSKVRTTDWGNLVLQNGSKQNHHLKIVGGSEKLDLVLTLSYYNSKGLQKGQGFERISNLLGLDYQLSRRLKLGIKINTAINSQDWGADLYDYALRQFPLALPYDSAGKIIDYPGNDRLLYTPLGSIKGEIDDRNGQRYLSSSYVDWELAKGLHYRLNIGTDFQHTRRGVYQDAQSFNRFGGFNVASYENTRRSNLLYESVLTYGKSIQNKHTLDITLLHGFQHSQFVYSSVAGSNLPPESQSFNFLKTAGSASYISSTANAQGKTNISSLMSRINFSYLHKYLFTLTGRRDITTPAQDLTEINLFGSLALAWKLHKEPFFNQIKGITEFKLRTSYGRTGNSAFNNKITIDGFFVQNYAINQLNTGIDFVFSKGRIAGHIDAYQMLSSPQKYTLYLNVDPNLSIKEEAVTQSSGVEIGLKLINIDNGNWRWVSSLTFAKNRDRIKGLKNKVNSNWIIGERIVSYYDYKPIGVWSTAETTQAAEYNARPGWAKYQDVNNDKKINSDDRLILGTNAPDFIGSIEQSIAYKNWELSFLMLARIGQTLANDFYLPDLYGRFSVAQFVATNYWTPARQDNVQYARPFLNQTSTPFRSFAYQDGSFVKVRNISLNYNFSEKLTAKMRLRKLNIYFTASNPFVFSTIKITNPEFYSAKLDFIDQVQRLNLSERSFILGFRLGL